MKKINKLNISFRLTVHKSSQTLILKKRNFQKAKV